MGKIRIKTLGDESQEQEQRNKRQKELEGKKVEKKKAKVPGLKGGESVVVVGGDIEGIEQASQKLETAEEKKEKKALKRAKKRVISKRFTANLNFLKKDQIYPLDKAIELLKKFKKAKFDETVELHINVSEKGISGTISLPHGTGKQTRIKVVDPSSPAGESGQVDELISNIEKGIIDFDILVATPDAMPKLAKVAKILGPRGLMPNPKAGTISDKPEEVVEKLSKGQVNYKTESQAPIIHLSVGKTSFSEKQIEENVKAMLSNIGASKIQSVTLKSTMSPAIRLDISSFSSKNN